ncbi:MAG: hypothetical protein LH649_03050, partial [Pseudanabaena sp. CAN_BIN31]|nr:hypothetical protein [Pseudanabaena sp. CAN_BIN31]
LVPTESLKNRRGALHLFCFFVKKNLNLLFYSCRQVNQDIKPESGRRCKATLPTFLGLVLS